MIVGFLFASLLSSQVSAEAKTDIERAVAMWRSFDMPLPSSKVVPVRLDWSDPGSPEERFDIGLMDENGQVTLGLEKVKNSKAQQLGWTPVSLRGTNAHHWYTGEKGFPVNPLVVTEVQCAALGKLEFATAIDEQRRLSLAKHDDWDDTDSGWIGKPLDSSLTAATALAIATTLVNQIPDHDSDREAILAKLRKIEAYKLLGRPDPPRDYCRSFSDLVNELAATVKGTRSIPGSPEAAVDRLIDLPAKGVREAVAEFGMRAVPALAEALESKKLTRMFHARFRNSSPSIVGVSDVAQQILQSVARGELGEYGQLKKRDVLSWYRAKQAGDMRLFLLTDLVEDRGDIAHDGHYFTTDSLRFGVMAKHYPQYLATAYKTVLAVRPPIHMGYEPELDTSKLSQAEKRAIFVEIARSKSLEQRSGAMWYLSKYDQVEFDKLLVETFDSLPATPSEPYAYAPEGDFSDKVTGSSNPKVWQAYERAVRRADPSFRVVLIDPYSGGGRGVVRAEGSLISQVKFLQKFFDDSAVPAYKKGDSKYSGFGSFTDDDDKPLSVGQVALRVAAYALNIEHRYIQRSPDNWRELRAQVNKSIALLDHGKRN